MHMHLVEPRHHSGQHPYLPNGIVNFGSRFESALPRAVVTFTDLNVDAELPEEALTADAVGIGVLGTPLIPQALDIVRKLRHKRYRGRIVVGGQGVMRLRPEQFARIYGSDVAFAADDDAIEHIFGVRLPSRYDHSMFAMLSRQPKRYLEAYFTREWCLFTSDGCAYRCGFCAASKGQRERFRSKTALWQDLEIATIAIDAVAETSLSPVYLSSLDIAQNPEQMEDVLTTACAAGQQLGIRLAMRGLATAKCLVKAVVRDPEILHRWREYGVTCIGLGVDNSGKAVWTRERKQHNTDGDIDAALLAISNAGMTPEALTVIGFREDSPREIAMAVENALRYAAMPLKHRVVVRPYLGKKPAPGSDAWQEGDKTVEVLLRKPELFRRLEYGMLGSSVTHPQRGQRIAANLAFLGTVLALKATRRGCPTQPLLPTDSGPLPLRLAARSWNRLVPGDR